MVSFHQSHVHVFHLIERAFSITNTNSENIHAQTHCTPRLFFEFRAHTQSATHCIDAMVAAAAAANEFS